MAAGGTYGAHARAGDRAGALPLALFACLSALAGLAVLELSAAARAGWVFEYPLDDVYIHLAMAEQIAQGGYGVNAGEYASAASSPLYPVLLAIAPASELQRLLPLVWNVAGLIAEASAFGAILMRAGLGQGALRGAGLAVALIGPLALNMPGVAFLGMEHTLHAAVSLGLVLGLWRFLDTGRVGWLLPACMILGPMLRLEGLALSLLAAAVLVWRGRGLAGIGFGAAVIGIAAGFALFLTALGLDPLPSSVLTKMDGGETHGLDRFLAQFAVNLREPGGVLLAVLGLAALVLSRRGDAARRTLGLVLALAAFAHLFAGQIGWLARYEHYILVTLAAGLALLLPEGARVGSAGMAALGVAVLGAGAIYLPVQARDLPWCPRAIHLQHAQMARFATDYAQVPVAVNDLGRVAWANPDYVLDLWGLASAEARKARLTDPVPGWAGPLARAHGVRLAMVYDRWIDEGLDPGWRRLGTLILDYPRGFLGGGAVAFYATDPVDAPMLTEALARFAPTLPDGARFEFTEGGA